MKASPNTRQRNDNTNYFETHGNFFYYDKAPEQVKFMVDKLNLDALAEVWKVTKDKRL